jgi:CRP/FNR family transcriptional regulator
MNHEWLCVTCRLRDQGICGALVGKSSPESRSLEQRSWQDFERININDIIVKRGDESKYVYVLCEGWAFRFFRTREGQKQILNFLLPGDLVSAVSVFENRLGYSVQALTEVQLSRFSRAQIRARLATNPAVLEEVGKSWVTEHCRADELLTVLGQRSAEQRISYLFLHLMERISTRSVIREQRYPFPLRQQHIAEILGLTSVHVNRVLGTVRDRGLIELSGGFLKVLDLAGLKRLGSLR